MNFFKKEDSFLGIDIGKYSIKAVEIGLSKGEAYLKNLGHSNLSLEAIVDEMIINSNEIIEKNINLIKHYKITTKETAISLPGNAVIIKRLNIKGETYEDISANLQAEASNHIPYNLNDVQMTFHIFEDDNSKSDSNELLLIAVKKDVLNDYITILIESGLRPVVADVDFFALQNIFEFNYKDEIDSSEVVSILNIGSNLCNILVLKNFKSLFYRDANIGNFVQYQRAVKNLNLKYEEIEKLKIENSSNKHIKNLVETINKNLITDIAKGLDLFINSSGISKIDKFLISGGGSFYKDIKKSLSSKFPKSSIDYLDPFKKIAIDESKFDKEYIDYIKPMFAVSAGLSIRGLNGKD